MAAVGEEFVLLYSRGPGTMRLREYDSGAWTASDVTFSGASFVSGATAASPHGEAMYVHYDGHVVRLRQRSVSSSHP
jgi:hypothetical protein